MERRYPLPLVPPVLPIPIVDGVHRHVHVNRLRVNEASRMCHNRKSFAALENYKTPTPGHLIRLHHAARAAACARSSFVAVTSGTPRRRGPTTPRGSAPAACDRCATERRAPG